MQVTQIFRRDERGSVAVIFALAMVPILGLMGLAIDYSAALQMRTRYQAIADAGALAGATASTYDSDAARKTFTENWLKAEFEIERLPALAYSVSVKDGEVSVTMSGSAKPLMGINLTGPFPISVQSVATTSQEGIRRVLDVAMCIDATGSMQGTINSVQERALNFSSDLNNALKNRGLGYFDYMRIRVIYYRDFAVDGIKAISESAFYPQPDQASTFRAFVASQSANGGGDEPESGYECIHQAMVSPWFKVGADIPGTPYKATEVYPSIILWSDANAQPLGHGLQNPAYPANMPMSEPAYINKWNSSSVIDQKNRLLVHFGLCDYPSWALARNLKGYMCGGSLLDGNTNMISKIADVMVQRYKNGWTRLMR